MVTKQLQHYVKSLSWRTKRSTWKKPCCCELCLC